MAGSWFFKPEDAGSSPVTSTKNIIGMDYGDSRVCKTLAGEFESLASHKNLVSSSNGRTPASQVDVNAGSIPVKSTKRIFECKQVQYQSLGPYRQ